MGVGPECAGARYRWLQAGSHDLRDELRDCVDCADIAGPPECQTAEGICGCDPEAKRVPDPAGAPGVVSFILCGCRGAWYSASFICIF